MDIYILNKVNCKLEKVFKRDGIQLYVEIKLLEIYTIKI